MNIEGEISNWAFPELVERYAYLGPDLLRLTYISRLEKRIEEIEGSIRTEVIKKIQPCNWADIPDQLEESISNYWNAAGKIQELKREIKKRQGEL